MIFLSLGTNLYDKRKNLDNALFYLQSNNAINLITKSKIYKTSPMENKNQNYFLNMVINIKTTLKPFELLTYIKSIEIKMGRKISKKRYMPRIIDIDILSYKNKVFENKTLTIPHPKAKLRKFILKPWNDIAPNFILPNENKSINLLLESISNLKDSVVEYK